jgi:hypothetical protein
MSTTPAEITRFDAENATALAVDFLKRLGYKENWLPMKVSIDGELYVVEIMFRKLSAKVQISSKTKEIKEYELTENESEARSIGKSKKLVVVVALVALAAAILKLLRVF